MSQFVKDNLLRLMAARAMGVSQLARQSGLDVRTIRAVVQGRSRPRAATLHRLAEGLGVKVDELFLDPAQLLYRRFDQQTNPVVEDLMEARGELFDGWTDADFEELHSRVASGGGLTFEGALDAVERMNRKRRLHQRLEVLLESSQSQTIRGIIELLYDQVVARGEEPDGQ